jgi:hypothetical protein
MGAQMGSFVQTILPKAHTDVPLNSNIPENATYIANSFG